jgi:hypothetical protein
MSPYECLNIDATAGMEGAARDGGSSLHRAGQIDMAALSFDHVQKRCRGGEEVLGP